jgi:hypothetical protein
MRSRAGNRPSVLARRCHQSTSDSLCSGGSNPGSDPATHRRHVIKVPAGGARRTRSQDGGVQREPGRNTSRVGVQEVRRASGVNSFRRSAMRHVIDRPGRIECCHAPGDAGAGVTECGPIVGKRRM